MSRKLQSDADKLQKASEQMNMRPVWEYTKNMRRDNKSRHRPIKKENGEHANNLKEEMQCWQNWIEANFQQNPKDTIPRIMHIPDETWGKQTTEVSLSKTNLETHPELTEIRKHSRLQKLLTKDPHIYTWLTKDYTKMMWKSDKNTKKQQITRGRRNPRRSI